MDRDSVAAAADRVSDERARLLPVLTGLFVAQQASYCLGYGAGTGDRPIHDVQLVAWVALSTVMLLVLTTGGAWFHSRAVRRRANDEVTRAHRDAALGIGFIASMVACIVLYLVSMTVPVPGREAVHAVMSIGIATALLRFAVLERRATQNG